MAASHIDGKDQLVGDTGASRPASARTVTLPDVNSLLEFEQVLAARFRHAGAFRYARWWVTPGELSDLAERYRSQILVRWDEYGADVLRLSLFWREPRASRRLEFTGFRPFPSRSEALRELREPWGTDSIEPGLTEYLDALPGLADVRGRFQLNFEGQPNGGLLADYGGDTVAADQLWSRLMARAAQLGLPLAGAHPPRRWWEFWK